MRSDVKVFCVVVISLVLVGVWFFMIRGRDGRTPVAQRADAGQGSGESLVGMGELPARAEPTGPAYLAPEPGSPSGAGSSTPRPSTVYEGVLVGYVPEASTGAEEEPRIPERPVEWASNWWQGRRNVPSRMAPGRTEPDGAAAATPLAGARARTYRVKHGDSYWTIAKAQYGDGALYKLLEEANANVPADSLRPNLTIKIPPRPENAAQIRPSAPTIARAVAEQSGKVGNGYYVVKKGDNGFWGVSIAVFKTPRRWQEIAALNPGLDSGSLKPGQKVRIPDGTVATVVRRERVEPSPAPLARRAAPAPSSSWIGTGAPAKTALPNGRVFD